MKGIKIRVCADCPYWVDEGDDYFNADLCGHRSVLERAFRDRLIQREEEPPEWCPLEKMEE